DWRASDPLLPIIPALTNRGFTGHEHIDEMGFIHMNGRVYDPQIGRFLSADPYIQAPYNTQSYNRYSYVMNNPLKYTDPSGYWWNPFKAVAKAWRSVWRGVKKYGRQIASIAVLFIPGLNIYAAGFLSGMVGSKGDLKQGLLGALTAGFNAKVLHPMKAGFRKLIAHGLTGGVRSRLSGGSFKSGFLGSAVSYGASWSGAYKAAGVSNQANTWTQRVQNVVASYVVGGVAAELGGGKFANGGMSAAFSRMFNDLRDSTGKWIEGEDPEIKKAIQRQNANAKAMEIVFGAKYNTPESNISGTEFLSGVGTGSNILTTMSPAGLGVKVIQGIGYISDILNAAIYSDWGGVHSTIGGAGLGAINHRVGAGASLIGGFVDDSQNND
ncbi:hypothetical protein BPUTSESOX_624, partial [uncultured Gammaproteobacteria bacterium]